MRGLVFTEFLDFVENTAGAEMVEKMLDNCDLDSGGAYTRVGFYNHQEILEMLTFLNTATGQDVSEMVTNFGQHLFGQLIDYHPEMMQNGVALLDFLEGIETHIHREVRKLYPDAELPYFEAMRTDQNHLTLNYKSARPFADLAYGMISGAIAHFGKLAASQARVVRENTSDCTGHSAIFRISLT